MNAKLENALERLNRILPLRQRQDECDMETKVLYQQILRSFVSRGRMPNREEMSPHAGNLDAALKQLRDHGMVVFSADGDPVGAYPFTMEPREHKVRVNGYQVHAMCALDALAVSPMFGLKTQIDSRCRTTGDRVGIRQSGTTIENPEETGELHVGIAWGAADERAGPADSLCREMIFLRDGEVARRWHSDDFENKEIFTLPVAVEFARRHFVPLVPR